MNGSSPRNGHRVAPRSLSITALKPKGGGKRLVSKLTFTPHETLVDDRLPGGKGELLPLKDGQVLLVATYPGSTTEETIGWIQKACQTLVDDGTCDAAVYLPEGWKLDVVHVEERET